MSYKWLKRGRVIVALIFIVATSLVFLDFRDLLTDRNIRWILYLQFVPSLLRFLTIFSLAATGFVIVLLLTLLFGRVYCSAICPLGIFQDIVIRVSRLFKSKKKNRFKYSSPWTVIRNLILGVTLLISLFFTVFLLNLLDPYSIYGKMATGLFRPVGIVVNNLIAGLLESMNIFYFYLKDQNPVHILSIAFPIIALVIVIYMSAKRGRLYCNTICPVGTLLGWLSRFSFFRIRMDQTACTQCGKCAVACKAECINVKERFIDQSRCVACYNCLPVCNDSAIRYSFKKMPDRRETPPPVIHKVDTGRKQFISTSISSLLLLTGIRNAIGGSLINDDDQPLNKKATTVPIVKTSVSSPPGSLSIDHFNSICTACQLCVSQCPTKVLQPSVSQYGFINYMQPFMDYDTNYCNFECVRCAEICPTGAILSLDVESKKTLQIGRVHFIKENCVVYTENTACGSCSEHCPTQAVKMVPYIGNLTIPETDNTICVGCGACENACPVVPYKAIYVDGHRIHETAQKPKSEKLEEPSMEEEFPF